MGIRACVTISAAAVHLKVPAQLCLLLALILLPELNSLFGIGKLFLLSTSCGFAVHQGLSDEVSSLSVFRVVVEMAVMLAFVV